MNFIDTAESYGPNVSEELIREEDDLFAAKGFDNGNGISTGTADVAFCFDIGVGVDVRDDGHAGVHRAQIADILCRYGIEVPAAVKEQLEAGGLETPKPGDPRLARCETHLIATPQQSLDAAAEAARALGQRAYVLSDEIEGESREVGKVHAALARSATLGRSSFEAPCVILSGGETTVTVRPRAEGQPKGRGGRAGEFCPSFAFNGLETLIFP